MMLFLDVPSPLHGINEYVTAINMPKVTWVIQKK